MKSVVVLLLLSLPAVAQTTFVVNNPNLDTIDAAPGDGICADASGNCSCTLRAAIIEANAFPGADTIILPAGSYALGINGINEDDSRKGDLDITDSLTINGAGALTTKIDGNHLDTVIHVHGGTVTITGVTITGGEFIAQPSGGGVAHRGGTLTLSHCVVTGNHAFYGAGINSKGDYVILKHTTVSDNKAYNNYGGVYKLFGTLSVDNCTVSNNIAQQISGLYSGGALTTITNSTFSGNTATHVTGGNGGGVVNGCELGYQTIMTINNSTISGNGVTIAGGGVYNRGDPSCPMAQQPVLTITNSTITENSAGSAGGGIRNDFGVVSLNASIVAKNIGGDCSGAILSQGYNLSSDASCNPISTDMPNTPPLLMPLALNAPGFTKTHEPSAMSPAVGTAPCIPPFFDQRGVPRTGPQCDRGSYEVP